MGVFLKLAEMSKGPLASEEGTAMNSSGVMPGNLAAQLRGRVGEKQ